MISHFPDFTPINMKLKEEIQLFTRRFDPYEDFSFVNLYTWDTNGKAGVAWLNNNLVIKIPNYTDRTKFSYTFIGLSRLDETVSKLLDTFPRLELIPTFIVSGLLQPDKYAIAEDRDNFDYMYEVKALAELSGRQLRKKRNLFNTAQKTVGKRVECKTVNKLNPEILNDIEAVIAKWLKITKQSQDDTAFEEIALKRLVGAFGELDLWATLCYVDNTLNGFSVHEIVSEEYAICHFEKSLNQELVGINTILIKESALFLSDKSTIVNWQQDLGIEGLRKAKRAYAPSYYLKKYWISRGTSQPQEDP